jgi:hypothetical protein
MLKKQLRALLLQQHARPPGLPREEAAAAALQTIRKGSSALPFLCEDFVEAHSSKILY